MVLSRRRIGVVTGLLALVVSIISAGEPKISSIPQPREAVAADSFGAMIPRTMKLLADSGPKSRTPVKILYYGQSITVQPWWRTITRELRRRFPAADITAENPAIGGFTAPGLIRTAVHDLYPPYPDLVVFHVYGGIGKGGQLEAIIANIRKKTSAEIILWTHHVGHQGKTPAAVAGNRASNDKGSTKIRQLAEKYGCELVEVRREWKQYLKDNNLQAKDLLADGIHLNRDGQALMAKLIGRHFKYKAGAKNPWSDTITTHAVTPGDDGIISMRFEGNRVDIIAGPTRRGQKLGSAKILIDGASPSKQPQLYTLSRPSKAPYVWWPAIGRVSSQKLLQIENWTLQFTEMADDGSFFKFNVIGSKTGPDGGGNSKEKFVSNSGRIVIERRDWHMRWAVKYSGKPVPKGFKVTWSVIPMFVDTYRAVVADQNGRMMITPVAWLMDNTTHTLEIIPNGDGDVPVQAVRIHTPPLKEPTL